MKSFDCRVVDAQGQKSLLQRTGPSVDWVLRDLNQEGYFILEVKESTEAGTSAKEKLNLKTIIEFTQTLSILMGNGLTLRETLEVAKHVFPSSSYQKVFTQVASRVDKGDSLYQSLTDWKKSFPALYLGLIRIGEKTGDLAGVLTRLSEYLVTRKAIRDKTGNALSYPLFVMAISVIGLSLLMAFVFPTLTSIVGSLNKNAAQAYNKNLQSFQLGATILGTVVVFVVAALVFLFWQRKRDSNVREKTDALLLKVPLLRSFLFANFGLNLSFALETLLSAGYPVEEALEEGAEVVSNLWLRKKILSIREKVVKGVALSQAFREEGEFPETFIGWIAVGEGSHDLIKCFAQLRKFYQQELDKFNNRFLSLVEPALILVVGSALLFMILTFITPVFTMLGNLL